MKGTDMTIRRRFLLAASALIATAALAVGVPSAAAQSTPHVPNVPSSQFVTVSGIRVHQAIAAPLRDLLAAASSAGHTLTGSGHRSTARQIRLRVSGCGTSPWAVHSKPPGDCGTPVATPGNSMHQLGLAVDFSVGGRLLRSTDSAFTWLSANASDYGLYNLPSEPWHWSINGR